MFTSLDGKITGSYMDTPEGIAAIDVFYRIAFEEKPRYQHQGWLSRRMTTDDNFTYYRVPYPSWKTTCRLFQRGISYVIVGKEVAKDIYKQGICLEEYLLQHRNN